jgi:GTP-binding protein
VLVYVIDGSTRDPSADVEAVRSELHAFSPQLAARPHLVMFNKVDLEPVRALRARTRSHGVLFGSALTGEGLPQLRTAMANALAAAPEPALPQRAAAVQLPAVKRGLVIDRRPWGFVVRGERVERLVERTNLDSEGALDRFQVELERLGVNRALEKEGVQPGDTVRIGSAEFEYQP